MMDQPGLMEYLAPSIGQFDALLAGLADSLADECALSNDIAVTSEGVARMMCGIYTNAQMVEYQEKPINNTLSSSRSFKNTLASELPRQRVASRIKPPTKVFTGKR